MNTRPPKLSWHKHRRLWFVKWAGKFRWLGQDERQARRMYVEELARWQEWREARDAEFAANPPARMKRTTIGDLALRFYDARTSDGRSEYTVQHLKYSLRRFVQVFADYPVSQFKPRDLESFKVWLRRIMPAAAPRTINHQIDAARNMLNWAGDLGLMPSQNYRGIKPMAVPPPEPHGYTLAQAKRFHRLAPKWLAPWIALTWYTLCRPTEAVRLVHRIGDWCGPDGRKATDQEKARDKFGLFRLLHGHSKTEVRYIVFSKMALDSLAACEPRFQRPDAFSRACARNCDGMRPHFLRHGGAATLGQRLRGDRARVDLILGHYPSRVSRTYQPIDWRALRQSAARIPRL